MSGTQLEYRFTIDAYSPDTLPMSRLAEYMADLARLLGEVDHVHFLRLEPGSTALVQCVESEAVPGVQERIRSIAHGNAPNDVLKPFRSLNTRLAADNASGSLQEGGSGQVVKFPGRNQPDPLTYDVFNEPGVLDGVLIRIGGRDQTVPVHLSDGNVIHICNATREMARQLARHLYGNTLRVEGIGRWKRDANGTWLLKRFNIKGFQELSGTLLSKVVDQLRSVKGSGWRSIDDPSAELRRLRRAGEAR